jgi:hypothetical protein
MLSRAPKSSYEFSSALKSTHEVLLKVIDLWNPWPWHYIYIYIIIGRSLVLLKAPKSFHEFSSAFESTHEVFSKVIY